MIQATRTVVFAYHDVGCGCIETLLEAGERIAAIFSHEDAAGENLWFGSVPELAKEHAIPLFTPRTVNDPQWIRRMAEISPDLIFSFYYRRLICDEILATARLGAFNMHGSLLPRYRGRAPVNWAIVEGETETGMTLHHMVAKADAGAIVDSEAVPIGADDGAADVMARLVPAARSILARRLPELKAGTAPSVPQNEAEATTFPRRRPEDGRIDFAQTPKRVHDLVRAVTHPYPGAFTFSGSRKLFIWRTRPVETRTGRPGEVLATRPLTIACGSGAVEALSVQWDGAAETDGIAELPPGTILDAAGFSRTAAG